MGIVRSTACFGIFPADIVVRTAVIESFDELRAQPWLLDFAFQALLNDDLTRAEYGETLLEEAKNWFLENDVKVTLGYKINNISVPHVAIWMGEQSEAESTTGDTHDTPSESIPWVVAIDPLMTFTAAAYEIASGRITLPGSLTTSDIFTGMRVIDKSRGTAHEILGINNKTSFSIAAGSEVNLNNAQVVNANSLWTVSLESQSNREVLHIDVIAQADATKCIVLHGILRWCLNRSKQRLLEARGFERSTISSSGILVAADGDNAAQIMFKRTITLTGITREYWPKDVRPPVQGLGSGITIAGGSGITIASGAETGDIDALEASQGWSTVDEDGDTLGS